MFDILPNTLSLILTTLLPIYAAHKALSTPASFTTSPPTLAPWLTYFLLLSVFSLVDPFLMVLPFSAYIRLFLRLWLLLPGETQGATFAYRAYVQPFLHQHERDIEAFVNGAHDQGKEVAAKWIRKAVEWIKMQILGQTATQAQANQQEQEAKGATPYAQRLLALLNGTPSQQAGNSTSAVANNPAASLSTALQQATAALAYATAATNSTPRSSVPSSTNDTTQPQFHLPLNLTDAAAALIPAHLSTPAERLSYVSAQKERLRALLGAFEKEETSVEGPPTLTTPASELNKSGSEADFDSISHDDVPDASGAATRPTVQKSKSWVPWGWGAKSTGAVDANVAEAKGKGVSSELEESDKVLDDEGAGKSSAVEI